MQTSEIGNAAMLMDLYELTMANGYYLDGKDNTKATFDVFFRKNPDQAGFSIFAGLEQIIDYIENLHFGEKDIDYLRGLGLYSDKFLDYLSTYRFKGDIYAFREGTIIYPSEPIITVCASLIDCQLIETAVLNIINHQSLVATKAARIVKAAQGRGVSDFGARRAHNQDAAVYGARAAYIGGADSTATVLAGQLFDIPVSGTMAHSWVMSFPDEYSAFKRFAEIYPDSVVLLIDTYDVMESGVVNAIRVFREYLEPMGKRLKGVRIDSGDLAYLSKKVRSALDKEGLNDCKIIASNSLDEYTITSILNQGGCFDSFGVGERLITAKSDPVFGAVYKLSEIEIDGKMEPKIKISETIEKTTDPGRKEVYRVYDTSGHAIADYIATKDEVIDYTSPCRYINPQKPWKELYFEDYTMKPLQRQVIENGKRVFEPEKISDIREYVRAQLQKEIWPEEQRFENPHIHYMDYSPKYYELKMSLLKQKPSFVH